MLLFVRSHRFQGFFWIPLVFSLSLLSTSDGCRSDQFACRDGTDCIRLSYRCDGGHDCDDTSDEMDCERPVADDYLLVSVVRQNAEAQHVRPQIYQIDLATGHSKPLLRTDPGAPASLAVDMKKQVLYFVDTSIDMIGIVSLAQGNSSMTVIYRDPTLSADLDGLAIDTAKEKLYFSDGGSSPKIVEIDLLDRDRTQRIILSGSNLKPKALVIDEVNSELYWTDWGSKPGIFVIALEPNARLQTLVADNIVFPNALAIDFKEEVMFWVDAHLDRIEMSNLYGQNRRLLVKESGDVHYYAMTLSPQFLYIADWTRSTILRVDRATNITAPQMPTLSGLKTAIAYYNSNFTNVGRAGRTRQTVAPDETTVVSTSNGKTEAERPVKTVAPDETTLSTLNGKTKAERQFSGYGPEIVIVIAVAGSVLLLLLLLIIIPLAIWCGRRQRRRNVEASMTIGYSPAIAYDDGHSGRGRLLIEDAYVVKDNSYEHLPDVGMPPAPSPPTKRPEPSGCGMDDDWYSKLANDPDYSVENTGYYVVKKPTDYDYYDDTI